MGGVTKAGQPQPMFGRLPWFALDRRRRALRFLVFFDMAAQPTACLSVFHQDNAERCGLTKAKRRHVVTTTDRVTEDERPSLAPLPAAPSRAGGPTPICACSIASPRNRRRLQRTTVARSVGGR
jgi:hypothetical protein